MASLLKLFTTTQPQTDDTTNADNTSPAQPHTPDEQKHPAVPTDATSSLPIPAMDALDSDSDSVGGPFETLEEEIAFLRSQNSQLKHQCRHLRRSMSRQSSSSALMAMKINGQTVRVQQPQLDISLDELACKVEARLPKFLCDSNIERVRVPTAGTSEHKNEIGVIDITSVDWGDLVKMATVDTTDALRTFDADDDKLEVEGTEALGGSFIVLRESDIIDAIACFVAQCVLSIPECHNLDHDQMLTMITGTFSELKSKGPLGRMQEWGAFIYQTYGYTATAYTVYSNAAMAKTVLSCLVSAAWLIGVL